MLSVGDQLWAARRMRREKEARLALGALRKAGAPAADIAAAAAALSKPAVGPPDSPMEVVMKVTVISFLVLVGAVSVLYLGGYRPDLATSF